MKTFFLGLISLLIIGTVDSAQAQVASANLTCGICQDSPTTSACRSQVQSQANRLCQGYGYNRASSVVMRPVSGVIRRGFCYNDETQMGGLMNIVNMETHFGCQ